MQMLGLKSKPAVSRLARLFCKTAKEALHRPRSDPTQVFNMIHEGKLNLEHEARENYSKLRSIVRQITREDASPQYVPSHRAADVFRKLVEQNLLTNPGSEFLVTYLICNMNPESADKMAGFYKAFTLDHEGWTIGNLKTKLEVLIILLEFSPYEISMELVSAVDETTSTLIDKNAPHLAPFEAMDVATSILHINHLLKKSHKPELSKSLNQMDKLYSIFSAELQEVEQGSNLKAMIHVLDLLHLMPDNVSNCRNILGAIESRITKDGEEGETLPEDYWIKVVGCLTKAIEGDGAIQRQHANHSWHV